MANNTTRTNNTPLPNVDDIRPTSIFGGRNKQHETSRRRERAFEIFLEDEMGKLQNDLNPEEQERFRQLCVQSFEALSDEQIEKLRTSREKSDGRIQFRSSRTI